MQVGLQSNLKNKNKRVCVGGGVGGVVGWGLVTLQIPQITVTYQENTITARVIIYKTAVTTCCDDIHSEYHTSQA